MTINSVFLSVCSNNNLCMSGIYTTLRHSDKHVLVSVRIGRGFALLYYFLYFCFLYSYQNYWQQQQEQKHIIISDLGGFKKIVSWL